jgi:hypothetical protein
MTNTIISQPVRVTYQPTKPNQTKPNQPTNQITNHLLGKNQGSSPHPNSKNANIHQFHPHGMLTAYFDNIFAHHSATQ